MNITILDCYTDEPAGLGVPPYIGTYPRYIAGMHQEHNPKYITIDDLRLFARLGSKPPQTKLSEKTNISVNNLTKNHADIGRILHDTDTLIVILGVHTPGKYLSAIPGTLKEVCPMIKGLECRKILTGPAVFGTQVQGGKWSEDTGQYKDVFDEVKPFDFSYKDIGAYAIRGVSILDQIGDLRIAEIETSRGCSREKGCSFCTEPIKHRFTSRDCADIIDEIKALYAAGVRHFRLGKQSCFYSYPDAIKLLRQTREACPGIKVLHIDNVNPAKVVTDEGIEITKAIVKYCTEGNIAAFGVESFDEKVIRENNLNTTPEMVMEATRILNRYGAERGPNGMPRFLPGINILFGLIGESKATGKANLEWLKRIYDEGLLIRRINIREVVPFEGTYLYDTAGNKYLKKNRRMYWNWRNSIRQEVDFPMLKRIAPAGTVLKDVMAEIYEGKTTFGRQIGTYPLIIGIKDKRLPLKEFYDIEVTGHMLRSLTGKPRKGQGD